MRGFVFIGGEGPDRTVDIGLSDLDVVVAADSGLSSVVSRGIRADWVVGDMDSLGDPSLLAGYPADRVRTYPAEKDDTDTEIALALAKDLGCDERVIVGGGGGRLDHLLAIAALFERPDAPDRWITRSEDVLFLDSVRGRDSITVRASAGTLVSIFPVGCGPWTATSVGLQWPLDGLEWNRGSIGISNVIKAAQCRIDVSTGRFLVVLPLGVAWGVSSCRQPERTHL